MTNLFVGLIAAVIMVESGGDVCAVNEQEQAYGPMQIRQCALEDVNQEWGTSYVLTDFLGNLDLSAAAFVTYGQKYRAKTPESYCRIWNGGPKGMRKADTDGYWRKVQDVHHNGPRGGVSSLVGKKKWRKHG